MASKQTKGKNQTSTVRSSAPGTTLRYLSGILLIAVGTAWVLSLVASDGSHVMTLLRSYLRGLGGQLSPVFPFLLVWLGAALVVSCYHKVSFRKPLFALLLYLSVLAALTCLTTVRTQGGMCLLDYIKTYNAQHFNSGSFATGSFPAFFQQLFNWGYRLEPLAAGGGLSLIIAYPSYILFGAIGSSIFVVVLAIACLLALLSLRPTKMIRGASDAMERHRQRRSQAKDAIQAVEKQPDEVISPISEGKPVYTNTSNPYSNVRWIYDDPNASNETPAQEGEQQFMRPGMEDNGREEYQAPTSQEPNGPFVPINNPNELYHEPFVLHPDGAYDISDPAPIQPEHEESKDRPLRRPSDTQPIQEPSQESFEISDTDAFKRPERPKKPLKPATVTPEIQETPDAKSLFERPARKKTPETTTPPVAKPVMPVQEKTPAHEPEDSDDGLSKWQKQLKEIQDNLSSTRKQRQQLSQDKPEPVHTDPIDLPELKHVPIQPASTVTKNEQLRLDLTPMAPEKPVSRAKNVPYTPPPISFLSMPTAVNTSDSAPEDDRRAQQIERTLKTFNVDAQVREITHGPAITRFALKLAEGIKVKQVVSVLDNIMLEMGSDRIRIETPIPGTSYIGIEVPNSNVSPVTLREVLDSPEMQNARSPLSVALGKDIAGKAIIGDLSRMPHLLIAGATGSGKSVCINSIICSLLYRASPKDVRLIMVDPKQVELQVYNGIPHLLIPVVCDPKKAAVALNWTVNEMLERYGRFSKQNVRNLEGYNKKVEADERLPHIVVIIDEMADLMEVCRKDVEESIRRLAALARAAGIYLVLATQRPSVDVITGVIKNNIPSRIAFTVSSGVDSRTIIDINGAEKLMGKGDMLYLPVGASKPVRVQGCFVSDDEVAHIAENIQARYQPDYNHAIQDVLEQPAEAAAASEDTDDASSDVRESEFSDLLSEAIRMAVHDGQTSISMLQRTLRIGYARAGRIIDEMTKRGIISESEGSKPRKTIITRDEYIQMLNDGLLNRSDDHGA